ncbi:MAG: cell envelope biogenesis protein OmpA [Alistipes sp.]|nr:cell envelope biogenesis protein OmpA [Alistipes sp.]
MKKSLFSVLAAALLLAASGVVAQEQKKAVAPEDKGWWIGGEIGYWHEDGMNTFALEPEFGYDFNRRWSVGGSVGVVASEDFVVCGIAPYARWKFYNKGRLTLFLDGSAAVACGDMTGFRVGLQPGLKLRIADRFHFLTRIGFLGYCSEFYSGGDGDGFGLRFSSADLKFGFYYTF